MFAHTVNVLSCRTCAMQRMMGCLGPSLFWGLGGVQSQVGYGFRVLNFRVEGFGVLGCRIFIAGPWRFGFQLLRQFELKTLQPSYSRLSTPNPKL